MFLYRCGGKMSLRYATIFVTMALGASLVVTAAEQPASQQPQADALAVNSNPEQGSQAQGAAGSLTPEQEKIFAALAQTMASTTPAGHDASGEPAAQPARRRILRKLPGMVGRQPKLLCWLMTQFKETTTRSKIFLNRLLLYGKPGTGKSTIAQKFAQVTDSLYLARSACSMVEKFVGQGATNVAELFNTARQMSFEQNKKIVIFIDEIDSLASSNNTEFRAEHKAALQQLWIELDMCKNDPNIFVMFATNEFKKLSKTFLDRFGCNTLEIEMPGEHMRKKVLEYYFKKADLVVKSALLNKLAAKSKDLSNRALEDMVYGIAMATDLQGHGQLRDETVWETLKTVKDKFKDNTYDQDEQDKKLQKTSTWVSIVSGVLSSALNTYSLGIILGGGLSTLMWGSQLTASLSTPQPLHAF